MSQFHLVPIEESTGYQLIQVYNNEGNVIDVCFQRLVKHHRTLI